jgi:outer membrane biosynthesis protein TonB
MFNNKEMLPKNTQYLIAGAIGLYIVLMTRPAPAMITNLLSSSVAQIAALALVIYVGATQSLIVAVILAVAVVMSTPSREYMTVEEKKVLDKKEPETKKPVKKTTTKPVKDLGKEATKPAKPTPSTAEPKPANVAKVAEPAEHGEPAPAGHTAAEGTKKESFSLMNAADF